MHSKLIARCVALALLAPGCALAADNVTIYGKINLSLESVQAKGASNGGAEIDRMGRVTSNLSYMGLRGEEDLGNGLAAVWQVEQDVNPDVGAAGFASRNSYVGLKGGWGRAIAGRHDMYWTSHISGMDNRIISAGVAGSILAIFGTYGGYAADANTKTTGLMGGRAVNVLRYEIPNFDGLNGNITYSLGENKTADTNSADSSALQLELDYKKGPLVANLTHLHTQDSAGGLTNGYTAVKDSKAKATKFAAAYKFANGSQLGLGLEALKTEYSTGDIKREAWGVHAGHSFTPATYFGVTYGQAGNVRTTINNASSTEDTGAAFVSALLAHNLSKRTMVYAEYARINNEANAGYYFVSTGNLNNSAAGIKAGKGADPETVMVGINHTF